MDKVLKGAPTHWSGRDSIEFYSASRRTVKDLYDSEKVFLPRMLKKGMRVLDVGCAAGGFCNIMKEIEPGILYYGCDFTEGLIRAAKKGHGQAHFVVADSVKLPFWKDSFDLVNCAGTCHMIPDCLEAIQEIYRVSRHFAIFDVRLTDRKMNSGISRCRQRLCFKDDAWDGMSESPYMILNGRSFLKQLLNLSPKPKSVYATGYLRPPARSVMTDLDELCMVVFMIEKSDKGYNGRTEICMDIPYDYSNDREFKDEDWLCPSRLHDRIRQKNTDDNR